MWLKGRREKDKRQREQKSLKRAAPRRLRVEFNRDLLIALLFGMHCRTSHAVSNPEPDGWHAWASRSRKQLDENQCLIAALCA